MSHTRVAIALATALLPISIVSAQQTPAAVPFSVGEELVYRASIAGIDAGTAWMRVAGIDTIRGRLAYHLTFSIQGGIPGFRIRDHYDSWIDLVTLSSLRHIQQISQVRYRRNTTFEIYPDQLQYRRNDEPLLPSVANPLDDGSFVYAVRIAGITSGETRSDNRYFIPDRNPVVLTGVRVDTVKVGAGTFITTVVHPSIQTSGLFAKDTESMIWFSADSNRYPVQVKTRLGKFGVTLKLESMTRGGGSSRNATLPVQGLPRR